MLHDPRYDLDHVGRVMDRAADLLEECGWCRFPVRGSRPVTCVALAIGKMSDDLATQDAAHHRLHAFLGIDNTVFWNDHICKDQAQAVVALRGAARHKGDR